MCLGLMEANVKAAHYQPALEIDGYSREMDGLWESEHRCRLILYIKENTQYKRRRDLEPPLSPAIWVEVNPGSNKAWLLFMGYREWRQLQDSNKQKSQSMKQQLARFATWEESWISAES